MISFAVIASIMTAGILIIKFTSGMRSGSIFIKITIYESKTISFTKISSRTATA